MEKVEVDNLDPDQDEMIKMRRRTIERKRIKASLFLGFYMTCTGYDLAVTWTDIKRG